MEKHSIKWSTFAINLSTLVNKLRKEGDLCDVTLVSDDEFYIQAHKIVLASASNLFASILKKSSHSSSLICLTGIDSRSINLILDYIYEGEVLLLNEDLETFFKIAKVLKIESLGEVKSEYAHRGNITNLLEGCDAKEPLIIDTINDEKEDVSKKMNEDFGQKLDVQNGDDSNAGKLMDFIKDNDDDATSHQEQETELKTPRKQRRNKTGFLALDIVSKAAIDKLIENDGEVWICKICGRTAKQVGQIRQHVEIHMNDLSFPCHECDESFQTRKKLAYHVQKIHFGGWYYSCSECFTNYGSRERLKRHFNKKHNGQ